MSDLSKIADKLIERASAYQEPFGNNPDWVHSPSYPIATALREVAYILRSMSDSEQLNKESAG